MITVGSTIAIIFILFPAIGLTGTEIDWASILAALFCLAISGLGGLLIRSGWKIKQRIKRFRQYVIIIANQSITKLADIASITGATLEYVQKDINLMIKLRYFVDARLSDSKSEIIIGTDRSQPNRYQQTVMKKDERVVLTVTCDGCGARNTKTINEVAYCEYCGSPLK